MILDTNALLWSVIGDTSKVSREVQAEIDARVSTGDAAVSAITFWEMRHARRKSNPAVALPPIAGLRQDLLRSGLREIPLTGDILINGIELSDSGFHDDPMDQMIVATALSANLPLATADHRIRAWADQTGRLEIVPLR
ncbi:type II toxin-antitoxin system VapC family toxin [Candidatus Poriferisocius sp.]|uniref:type II toxin-antitoxin system VapC family toxin n=1 Tax=Candidatus Poriferisocius sp. TaxID=3101276 RepID=UPI003B02010F